MADNSSIMPEQIALFERNVTDHVWAGRLTTTDEVADLGSTFVVNGLVTPCRVSATSLIAPESIAGAGARIGAVTLKAADELIATSRSGNPSAPSYWELEALGHAIGIELSLIPAEYEAWRFSTEVYVVHGGAVYFLSGEFALRHRVLSADEVSLTFVQRLLPFMRLRPEELTGTMIFLTSVPARLAALGGLRGYRRALIDSGSARAEIEASTIPDGPVNWVWDTEFYDDVAAQIIGVDGVERVVTYIGYQRLVPEEIEPLVGHQSSVEGDEIGTATQ